MPSGNESILGLDYETIFQLRVRVHQKFNRWGIKTAPNAFLGYEGYSSMKEDHVRWLQLLDGSHGLSVYKMLEARSGLQTKT